MWKGFTWGGSFSTPVTEENVKPGELFMQEPPCFGEEGVIQQVLTTPTNFSQLSKKLHPCKIPKPSVCRASQVGCVTLCHQLLT